MDCLVFVCSRNRALQLDATLGSFLLHCQDAHATNIRVLFTVSDANHAKQYQTLIEAYQSYSFIQFVKEQDFRSDLLALVALYDHVLFLVDDNLFVRPFLLGQCVEELSRHPEVLGMSLRLGRNTRHCYPLNVSQALPAFSSSSPGILKFSWIEAEHDFGYPLEVSSSLYRVGDLYDLLLSLPFANPNTLEGELAKHAHQFSKRMPCLLCYEQSKTFCNPINMVQTAWENRAGQDSSVNADNLALKFEAGYRVDIHAYAQFLPNGAHQEVPLHLIAPQPDAAELPAGPFPLVSVVIPCYNQSEYLPEAVRSVMAQTFSDWEIVIVDDGSTDATSQVAQSLRAECSSHQIQVIRQLNHGLATARNAGIQAARGQYILPLDADDCLHPQMLQKTVSILQGQPEVSIVYTDTVTFGLKEEYWGTGSVELDTLCQRNLICYCSLFRKDMWNAVGGYNPNMIWGYEDWDFWVSCWGQGYRGERVPEGLFRYRIREGSMYSRAKAHDVELKAQIVANHWWLYDQGTQEWAREVLGQHESIVGGMPAREFHPSVPDSSPVGVPDYVESLHQAEVGMEPLVSVIVPTFNRPDTLRQALVSILQQTFTDYEIIVINDGGQEVGHIVEALNQKKNINYVRHGRNRGLAAARNSGIGVARGKYIAYLDDDDRYGPQHLAILVEHLESTSFQVAYTDAWRIWQTNENGRMVDVKRDLAYSQDFCPDLLLLSNYFPVLCMMHEKQCLSVTGGFDETLTTHEDWDLWVRLSRHFPFAHLKKITAEFTWREDGSSMTSERREDFLRTKRIVYQKNEAQFQAQPHLIPYREQELRIVNERVQKADFDCSIVIPVWNRVDLTQECLTHLAETTKTCSYEVIIVDNASTDGTKPFLETLGGDVQVITNPKNLGFAKACNQGAAAARGKYVMFLNNDTIPQPGWLDPLIQEMEADPQVAVVGSQLLFPDGKVQHAGVVFSRTYEEPYHLFSGSSSDIPGIQRRREMQAVTAACMLVRKDQFERVGGFDEEFLNGFEDVDFCLRIRENGMKVIYQPRSLVVHLTSQTPGRKDHEKANSQRLRTKWEGQWTEDEDLIAFQEGYVIQQTMSGNQVETSLYFRDDVPCSIMWEKVAELQRLLLGQRKGPLAELQHRQEIYSLLQNVDEWPGDIGILEWAGRVCETVGCPTEARRFWEKLLGLVDHPNARLGLARLALQDGDFDRAAVHIQVLHDMFPHICEGWVVRGIFKMQQQQYADAKQAFNRALSFDPDHRKARRGICLALMALKEWRQAWNACEALMLESPDDVESLKLLIQAGTELQNWKQLVTHLSRFVDRNPSNGDMRFALAGVLIRADQRSQAQYHYSVLATLHPDFEGLTDLQFRIAQDAPPVFAIAK